MANYDTQDVVALVKTVVEAIEAKKASVVLEDKNYVAGKVIVITGGGSGFGMRTAQIACSMGAKVVLADIREDRLIEVTNGIKTNGGNIVYKVTDVTDLNQMKALAAYAIEKYGAIDVMVNNAGIMPLAHFKYHEKAIAAWDKCIDINFRGVMYGICVVYDQMIKQGRGHIINISSVYGHSPVEGSGVYQATKSAVRFLTGTLRQETQGQIRTTIINPTGCADTHLFDSVVDLDGIIGAIGDHKETFFERFNALSDGKLKTEEVDIDSMKYWFFKANDMAEKIIYAINQPWGIDVSELTVRATGEDWIV